MNKAILESDHFPDTVHGVRVEDAIIIGTGRVVDETGRRKGTCIMVKLADGRRGGIWYDRDSDIQQEKHGYLSFVEEGHDIP